MITTGVKPGTGTFKCPKCGYVLQLSRETDMLPTCPGYKHDQWRKIG